MPTNDMSAQQRAGIVTFWLAEGNELTTAEIARLTGLTWDGAWVMMGKLCGVLPLVHIDKKWSFMTKDKTR